jgi:hypothetical protein
MRLPMQEMRNARIDGITDPYGKADPLSAWRLEQGGGDISGIYADADQTIYLDSKTDGLIAKGTYEERHHLRFRVTGSFDSTSASNGATTLQQETTNNPVIPGDQFSATTQGVRGIKAFAAGGGKFTNEQDQHGNTAAHYAACHWAAGIQAFAAAGGKFTDLQNQAGLTVAHLVANHGSAAINAFAEAGGKFTDLQDRRGISAAHYAAVHCGPDSAETIKAFAAAGGKFTDLQDSFGNTAAHYVVDRGAETIKAFAEAGGKFTDLQNRIGNTAAHQAASHGAETIKAFAEAGGKFAEQQNCYGKTPSIFAADRGAEATKAFAAALIAQQPLGVTAERPSQAPNAPSGRG